MLKTHSVIKRVDEWCWLVHTSATVSLIGQVRCGLRDSRVYRQSGRLTLSITKQAYMSTRNSSIKNHQLKSTSSNLQLLTIRWPLIQRWMRLARGASVQTGCADHWSGRHWSHPPRDCAGHGWLRPAGPSPETGQTEASISHSLAEVTSDKSDLTTDWSYQHRFVIGRQWCHSSRLCAVIGSCWWEMKMSHPCSYQTNHSNSGDLLLKAWLQNKTSWISSSQQFLPFPLQVAWFFFFHEPFKRKHVPNLTLKVLLVSHSADHLHNAQTNTNT